MENDTFEQDGFSAPPLPDIREINRKGLRKASSLSGTAIAVLLLSANFVQIIITVIAMIIGGIGVASEAWYTWVCLIVSEYVVAFPLAVIIMKADRDITRNDSKLSLGGFTSAFFISCFAMYGGSLIGNWLIALVENITGLTYNSAVESMLDGGWIWVEAVVVCLLAPFFEEFVCRRLIIDRLRAYGEKSAVFFSAFVFALFHCTPEQIPYAFTFGLVLAYVYCKTGKIRYTIALHGLVNLVFGIIPSILLQNFSPEIALTSIAEAGNDIEKIMSLITPELIGYIGFAVVEILFAVIGLVLLIVKAVNGFGLKAPEREARHSVGARFFSIGMIFFYVTIIVITAMNCFVLFK